MIGSDVIVYRYKSTHYLARFGDTERPVEDGRGSVVRDGEWWVWPAQDGGWLLRRKAAEDDADPERELEPRLARLALRLSGVPADA